MDIFESAQKFIEEETPQQGFPPPEIPAPSSELPELSSQQTPPEEGVFKSASDFLEEEQRKSPEYQKAQQQAGREEYAKQKLSRSMFPNLLASEIELGASWIAPIARITGHGEYADNVNRYADAYERAAEQIKGSVFDIGNYPGGETAKRTLRGIAKTLPTGLAAGAVGGPYAVIAVPAIQEADQAITAGKDAGLKGKKLATYVTNQGLIEALPAIAFQLAGLGGAESLLGGEVKAAFTGGVKSALKGLGISLLEELPEETVTELGHNLASAVAGVDPSALTPERIWQTTRDVSLQTVGTIGIAGAGHVLHAGLSAREAKLAGPRAEQEFIISSGATPSRQQWRRWGLPFAEGVTARQRKEWVEKQASERAVKPQPEVQTQLFPQEEAAQPAEGTIPPPEVAIAEAQTRPAPEQAQLFPETQQAPAFAMAPEVPGRLAEAPAEPGVQKAYAATEALPSEAGKPQEAALAAAPPVSFPEAETEKLQRPKFGQTFAGKAKSVIRDLVSIVSPTAVGGEETKAAARIMRAGAAWAAHWDETAKASLNRVDKIFYQMDEGQRVDFIDRMEAGKDQQTDELGAVSKQLRTELDAARDRVRESGKLEEFNENYFPHLWRPTPLKDIVLGKVLKKIYNPSGFLKKRTIPTIKEGLEQGLELVTTNPVELALLRIHHMNEYVAKSVTMAALKRSGMLKFVPAAMGKQYLPGGYDFVDDPAFLVQAEAGTTVKEAFDKLLVDQLLAVANKLGVNLERVSKLTALGTYKDKEIKTRVGSPVSVLAHEIGHAIGETFSLHDYIVNGDHSKIGIATNKSQIESELKLLAALRHERIETTEKYIKYVQEPAEKEAVLLEAWLSAPEKMQEVAPHVTAIWKEFLNRNESVRPLLMLDRSLVLGTTETKIEQPGITVLGRWALPVSIAQMVKNQLSPGLRRNPNEAVKGLYQTARTFGNAMNQASLSLSAFHGLNVLTDTINASLQVGIQRISRGQLSSGAKQLLISPTAPITAYLYGRKLRTALRGAIEDIGDPALKQMAKDFILAGGRVSMDSIYYNNAIKGLRNSLYDLRHGDILKQVSAGIKIPIQSVFATLELTSAPVMQHLVPVLKAGLFGILANNVYDRASTRNMNDAQINQQLTEAWDSVDNRLGQLVYDNLFWNQYVKDVSMLAVRSTGWNLGSIREFGGAFTDLFNYKAKRKAGGDIVSDKQAYVMGAAISYATFGAILTYLLTGKPPEEMKDYYFPLTGRTNPDGSKERLSLPTYSRDMYSWATNPLRTARHKAHPMWGTFWELWTNEDYYGTEIRGSDDPYMKQFIDSVEHTASVFLPFSVKNYLRMREAGELPFQAAATSAFGITSAPSYVTRSAAHQLALSYVNIPNKPRPKEAAEQRQTKKKLVRAIRGNGELKPSDFAGLSDTERKAILKEARMPPLVALVEHLEMKQALDVFLAGTKREREDLWPMIVAKRGRMRTITPEVGEYYNEVAKQYIENK